jgi:cytoskeletal protein CcmA (bactofilin family)
MSANQNISKQSDQHISDDEVLLIGKNFNIVGDMSGTGTIIVAGKIEGNIQSDKVISEVGSSIDGGIECAQLDVSGSFKGVIHATNVIIRNSGHLEGEVHYITLAMEQGSQVLGKLKKMTEKQSAVEFAPDKIDSLAPAAKKADRILLNFPNELVVKLQDPAIRSKATLTLADGRTLPHWLSLSDDGYGVLVGASEMQDLRFKNESLLLSLNIDGNSYNFSLPL